MRFYLSSRSIQCGISGHIKCTCGAVRFESLRPLQSICIACQMPQRPARIALWSKAFLIARASAIELP